MVVAIRHVVSTDFRTVFFPYINRLLDERLLVGMGITGQEQLRPLAYSTLADLVHHVRHELTADQLARVIHLYSCHLHNPTLTSGIQNMCTKLLVALMECIVIKCSAEDSGRILMELLESFVLKLDAVQKMFQDWRALVKAGNKDKLANTEGVTEVSENIEVDQHIPEISSIEKAKPVQRATYVTESSEDVLKGWELFLIDDHCFPS